MNRCTVCLIPDTRPDTPFTGTVCSACVNHVSQASIDWADRKDQLADLLRPHIGRGRCDCIVPSSGGKDSTWQVLKLIEMGARPLVVTASTDYLTPIGRKNIDNLARYATTIEVTPNLTVRAKLCRLGLELVGDPSWPEHVAIFTIPFKVASQTGINLIFYGENPQNAYGGPSGTEDAMQLTTRWRSEFGGFLGLRPSDLVGQMGLLEQDLLNYMLDPAEVEEEGIEAYFLGQFLQWDSHRNAKAAVASGMQLNLPSHANWWMHENLDNAMTGLHDHLMFRKYGYGRGCAQISVDIRAGIVKREDGLRWVKDHDGWFPETYAGVRNSELLDFMGIQQHQLVKYLNAHTNWDLFGGTVGLRPILKEFITEPHAFLEPVPV